MKQGADDFSAESTPVIDIRKHGLEGSAVNASANDPTQNWDNDKTEVYMETDEDDASASLVDEDGENYPITAFPFILGRGAECDLVLHGKGLSRKHIEIVFQSGRFVVNDLESLNGLKVNGYKVSRVILEEGDVIKLGEVNLTFTNGGAQAEEREEPLSSDVADPFGGGGAKKIVKIAALIVGVAVIGIGGYSVLVPTHDGTGSIVDNTPEVAPVVSAPRQTPVAPVVVATTPLALPKSAPPPSISLTRTLPAPVVEKAYIPPTPKPAPKPKASANTGKARQLLAAADNRYLDGDAEALFTEFKKYQSDSRLPQDLKYKLKAKHEKLAKLFGDYSKGQKAFVSGNSDSSFKYWTRFLENESRLFKKKRSIYADQVVTGVVDEYVSRGNALSQSGESHKAYKMWRKAVDLGDSVAAKIALDGLHNKSKQLYRKALRLEYVNSSKAKALWQEVVSLVPPGSEYYVKASSKLAWYERWGG